MGRADDRDSETLLSEADEENDRDTSEADEERDGETNEADVEDSKKKYKCTQPGCNARFLRPSRLTWHLRKHNDERPYKCDQEGCDRAYTNSSHLKRHLNTTHKPVTKTYECKECGVEVGSLFSLKRHQKKIHDPQRLTCNECGAKFRKKHCYNEHLSMHAGVAMYKCDICDQDFTQLRLLKKHQKIHEPQTYSCSSTGCNEVFDKWSKLTKHMETVHEFGHGCEQCDKKFKTLKQLRKHKAAHEKGGMLKACPYKNCPKFYFYEKNLDEHVMSVHEGRRFICDDCKDQFSYKIALVRHIQVIHEGKQIRPPRNKQSRRQRKDANTYKKSMVSKLSGIDLPHELEKRVLRRSPRIHLERIDEKITDNSKRNVAESDILKSVEKLLGHSSSEPEIANQNISEFSTNKVQSESSILTDECTKEVCEINETNDKISSDSEVAIENDKLDIAEEGLENIFDTFDGYEEEVVTSLPNSISIIVDEDFQPECTEKACDTTNETNEKISSDLKSAVENDNAIIAENRVENIFDTFSGNNEELVSSVPDKYSMIVDKEYDDTEELLMALQSEEPMLFGQTFDTSDQEDEEALLAALLEDLDNEKPMNGVQELPETSKQKDELMRASVIADLANDTSLTEIMQSEKSICIELIDH